jgi:hypothetical protein
MCHNVIWDEMYENDPDFNNTNYVFLKLGKENLSFNAARGYQIIEEASQPVNLDFPSYAELTGMYCIYKNNLYEGLDYIGISHYDKEHRLLGYRTHRNIKELENLRILVEVKRSTAKYSRTNVTELIENLINKNGDIHISLESHDFQKIYDQRVIMDKKNPDIFMGDGKNCIDGILEEYNAYFGTKYSSAHLKNVGYLNMCNCFMTPAWLFEKLMEFICPIIESRRLDIYDTQRLHRLQGGLLERYVAVFFALENIPKKDLSTVHQYWKKLKKKRSLSGSLKKLIGA